MGREERVGRPPLGLNRLIVTVPGGREDAHDCLSFAVGGVGELAMINVKKQAYKVYAPGQWLSVELLPDLGLES